MSRNLFHLMAFAVASLGTPALAQPVTPDMTCQEAVQTVNTQFLTNIMLSVVRGSIEGGLGLSVQRQAEWLNRFINLSRTGDAAIRAAEGLDRAGSMVGGGRGISEAQQLADESRARTMAESLMPRVFNACGVRPQRRVLYVMQDVLYHAGYMDAPAPADDVVAPPQPTVSQDQSPNVPASADFQAGAAARAAWETWFAAQSGDTRAGAGYWAGQRNLPKPGSCQVAPVGRSGDFTAGCMAAQTMLRPMDIFRKNQPDFKLGWNSLPVAPAPLADAQQSKTFHPKNCSYWNDVGSVLIDGACTFETTTINGNFGYVFTLKGGKKITVEYVDSQSGWHKLIINGTLAMGYEIDRTHIVAATLDLKQSFEVEGL